jgi:uncharacterized protein
MITTAVADTSFLFALTNRKDRNHLKVLNLSCTLMNEMIVLPISVLPEVCYLIASRLGHTSMRDFLNEVVKANHIIIEPIIPTDLIRVTEILDQYADSQLDFVDATIIAIAERKKICRILTLDRRDFTRVRPKHCAYFDILP